MEEWFGSACDGFVIAATHIPGSYEDFVRLVVPELQRRGLFQKDYKGSTLRENLGLKKPEIGGWASLRPSGVSRSRVGSLIGLASRCITLVYHLIRASRTWPYLAEHCLGDGAMERIWDAIIVGGGTAGTARRHFPPAAVARFWCWLAKIDRLLLTTRTTAVLVDGAAAHHRVIPDPVLLVISVGQLIPWPVRRRVRVHPAASQAAKCSAASARFQRRPRYRVQVR